MIKKNQKKDIFAYSDLLETGEKEFFAFVLKKLDTDENY